MMSIPMMNQASPPRMSVNISIHFSLPFLYFSILSSYSKKSRKTLTPFPMLRIIFTKNALLRDAFVASLSLSRNATEISEDFLVYQKADWILVYSRDLDINIILPTILDNWDPDRIYLPYIGRSVDMMHEIGDVILPNVFIPYVAKIEQDEPDTENDIVGITGAKFLEIYNEQKDYYVEDYGLSVG